MSRRILIISANRCVVPEPVFPLGLTCLAAALRGAWHQCRWLDILVDTQPLAGIIREYQPDLVGISVRNIDDVSIQNRETFFGDMVNLCAVIREHRAGPIVLGGSGFSIFPRELLAQSGADLGIAGEGEAAFLELVECLEHRSDYTHIPGLVFRRNGSIVRNAGAYHPMTLEVGAEDRPAAVAAHYLRSSGVMNVQTQRGCGFRCCYCTYPVVEGPRHRRKPPTLVAEEFEQLSRAGARYAFIVDSVFNSSPRHIHEICEAILERGVRLSWGCFLRPQGVTAELMGLMSRAGLAHAEFGCDSFCDEVLRGYQKDFTFADIRESVMMAREANVDGCCFFIAGGPGETYETLQQSYDHSLLLGNATIMAVVGMRIYPETALFDRALAEGRIQPDANLLDPQYYLASGMDRETISGKLADFARRSPNWIVGEPSPAYVNLVERLRKRGVTGPLWSYFSAIQRLWPAGSGGPV